MSDQFGLYKCRFIDNLQISDVTSITLPLEMQQEDVSNSNGGDHDKTGGARENRVKHTSDANDEHRCWICLSSDSDLRRNPDGCVCKDSTAYVHEGCIRSLLRTCDFNEATWLVRGHRRHGAQLLYRHGPCRGQMMLYRCSLPAYHAFLLDTCESATHALLTALNTPPLSRQVLPISVAVLTVLLYHALRFNTLAVVCALIAVFTEPHVQEQRLMRDSNASLGFAAALGAALFLLPYWMVFAACVGGATRLILHALYGRWLCRTLVQAMKTHIQQLPAPVPEH